MLEEARRLLRQVEAKPLDVHVPALLLYEVGNILILKTDLGTTSLDQAIENLEALPFTLKQFEPLVRRFLVNGTVTHRKAPRPESSDSTQQQFDLG